jgi:putative glutamine amidotransferase
MLGGVRPLIAIPGDPEGSIESSYLDALARAGADPRLLENFEQARAVEIRGLLLAGGAFDIPPEWYGQSPRARIDPPRLARSRLERSLLREAERAGLPVLGICNGSQLMAVHRGGTLVQDLATQWPGALLHERGDAREDAVHDVEIRPRSRLAGLLGETTLAVNSTHHQSVALPGRGVRVVGRAPDGVVEAIEDPERAFWVGVQWHPERLDAPHARRLFEAFVDAALHHTPHR